MRNPTDQPHACSPIVFGSALSAAGRTLSSIRATCDSIGLARSTFYYHSHRSPDTVALENKIVLRLHELRKQFTKDGYRQMTRHLQLEGFAVNRKRIARLMHLHGLTLGQSRPRAISTSGHAIENLWGVALPSGSPIWIADIAYVRINSGLTYAAAVIDARSRELLGYAVSQHLSSRLASMALHTAIRARRTARGCIHHSMSGTHYCMRGYIKLLELYELRPSLGHMPRPNAKTPQSLTSPNEIVQLPTYHSWDQVVERFPVFIESLYSSARVEGILSCAAMLLGL